MEKSSQIFAVINLHISTVLHVPYVSAKIIECVDITMSYLTCVSTVSGLVAGDGNRRLLTYVN